MVAESAASVANEEAFHSEYRAVHADGRVVWIREDAVLIRDDDGKPRYWLGIMLDVTEFVEARRDLTHLQNTYGALVEQIPAIVYQDATDDSWTTVYVSPQITTCSASPGGVRPATASCGRSICIPTTATARSKTWTAGSRVRRARSRSSTGWSRATAASCGSSDSAS